MNIEEIVAQLPKNIRDRLEFATEIKTERQPLPSLGLTDALGGGFGYGRMVAVHGSKSAGKSSAMQQLVAMAQAEGKTCAWLDAEKAFDATWAQSLGVDTDGLIVSRDTDMYNAGDQLNALIKAGVDLVVVDSIGALIQPSFLTKDGSELAGMEKTNKIGDFSKSLKAVLRSANFVNKNTLIVLISQQTTEINQTYTRLRPEGGKALEYYCSQIVKLQSSNSSQNIITKKIQSGNLVIDTPVGRKVHWEVEFNKLGPQGGTGTYEFYFQGEQKGIDTALELLQLAMQTGVVNRAGAWYKYGDESFQGSDSFVERIRTDDVFRKEVLEAIESVR